MSLRWYAARTTPLAEYAAGDHLRAVGVDVFLPCGKARPQRPGHGDAPLFPGYLFVHDDLQTQGFSPLCHVPQLAGLVAFDGEVPPVPDEVIGELVERTDAINGNGGLWTRFRVGEKVNVAVGPAEGLAEVIEEAKSPQGRVRVLLEFLGRLVEVQVPWKDVQPAAGSGNVSWNRRLPRRTRGRGRWIRGHGPRPAEASPQPSGTAQTGVPRRSL